MSEIKEILKNKINMEYVFNKINDLGLEVKNISNNKTEELINEIEIRGLNVEEVLKYYEDNKELIEKNQEKREKLDIEFNKKLDKIRKKINIREVVKLIKSFGFDLDELNNSIKENKLEKKEYKTKKILKKLKEKSITLEELSKFISENKYNSDIIIVPSNTVLNKRKYK